MGAPVLKFDENEKQIVFDHLSPKSPQFTGQYQYYGPDFSYDALEFKKGKWVYIKDVDVRNGKSEKDKTYTNPERNQKSNPKQLYNPSQKK